MYIIFTEIKYCTQTEEPLNCHICIKIDKEQIAKVQKLIGYAQAQKRAIPEINNIDLNIKEINIREIEINAWDEGEKEIAETLVYDEGFIYTEKNPFQRLIDESDYILKDYRVPKIRLKFDKGQVIVQHEVEIDGDKRYIDLDWEKIIAKK